MEGIRLRTLSNSHILEGNVARLNYERTGCGIEIKCCCIYTCALNSDSLVNHDRACVICKINYTCKDLNNVTVLRSRNSSIKCLILNAVNLCNINGNLNCYTVSSEAVLVKVYTYGKLNNFGRIVKKNYLRACYCNLCSLSNGGVDLTIYKNTACAVVIYASRRNVGCNGCAVGNTVKVKLEYTLSRISIALESYTLTGGKNDCGLVICISKVGILNSKLTVFKKSLGIKLNSANVSECTIFNNAINVAIYPHTVSVVRTVEGTAVKCCLATRCISTVSKYTISISNFSIVNTESKIHKACVSNIATGNLAESKICEGNLLACSLNVTLNVKIDLCVGILTNEADCIKAAGKRLCKSYLVENLNNNVATHSLSSLESLSESCIIYVANLNRLAEGGIKLYAVGAVAVICRNKALCAEFACYGSIECTAADEAVKSLNCAVVCILIACNSLTVGRNEAASGYGYYGSTIIFAACAIVIMLNIESIACAFKTTTNRNVVLSLANTLNSTAADGYVTALNNDTGSAGYTYVTGNVKLTALRMIDTCKLTVNGSVTGNIDLGVIARAVALNTDSALSINRAAGDIDLGIVPKKNTVEANHFTALNVKNGLGGRGDIEYRRVICCRLCSDLAALNSYACRFLVNENAVVERVDATAFKNEAARANVDSVTAVTSVCRADARHNSACLLCGRILYCKIAVGHNCDLAIFTSVDNLAVKIKSYGVARRKLDRLCNGYVLEKLDFTAICEGFLESCKLLAANLCNCGKCVNEISLFCRTAIISAGVNRVTLRINRGSYGLALNGIIVTESRNNFLIKLVVTSGAVLACSKTACSTSCINSLVNYDIVTKCVNSILRNLVVTSGAVLACGKTACSTSRVNSLVNYDIVTESYSCICLVFITAYTGMSGITAVYAIGGSYNCVIRVCAYGINTVSLDSVKTRGKLVTVSRAIVIMICGVEAYEATTGNCDNTKIGFLLINIKKEVHAIIKLLSLIVTAVDFNRTAASSVDCCATVRNISTVADNNGCAVD